MKDIIVIYHNDLDGFGAAWAAWKKFGNKAKYVVREYDNGPAPNFLKNKEIYFLDFCYPAAVMKKIKKEAKSVVIIDHHITSKPVMKIADNYLHDTRNSAAVLTWKYFFRGKPIPKILLYIEDEDLWRFRRRFTRELTAFLDISDFDFRLWDRIASDVENPRKRKKCVKEGATILKYKNTIIDDLLAFAFPVKFEGFNVLAVNSPVLSSEIGNALLKRNPPMAIIWCRHKIKNVFHLRSNSRVDVAKIAQKYGGGGHKRAAGFCLNSKAKLPWKEIK